VADKLTDSLVKKLPTPATGNRVTYDADVKGVRVTAAGARAFVLNYRTRAGRERRYTIGAFPDWRTTAARDEAKCRLPTSRSVRFRASFGHGREGSSMSANDPKRTLRATMQRARTASCT
jgi:hypothetical protein